MPLTRASAIRGGGTTERGTCTLQEIQPATADQSWRGQINDAHRSHGTSRRRRLLTVRANEEKEKQGE